MEWTERSLWDKWMEWTDDDSIAVDGRIRIGMDYEHRIGMEFDR